MKSPYEESYCSTRKKSLSLKDPPYLGLIAALFLFGLGELYGRPAGKAPKKISLPYNKAGPLLLNGSTEVRLARNFYFQRPEQKIFQNKAYKLCLYARRFAQGNLFYIEIKVAKWGEEAFRKSPQVYFKKKRIPLSSSSWGYRGFFGVTPKERIGQHFLSLKVFMASISSKPYVHSEKHYFWIRKTRFSVSREKIVIRGSRAAAGKKMSLEKKREISRFAAEKKRAFARYTDKILIKNKLSHPRSYHFITSPFWNTRYIARFKRRNNQLVQIKAKKRIHRGLDLRAKRGDPVYAMANGKVVISRRMHYEGNFVLLDHGQGIFSGYMHLSRRYAYRGQYVRTGRQIGKAGATGAVTGAHLHLLLYVRHVAVDPLSLLSLPVRS